MIFAANFKLNKSLNEIKSWTGEWNLLTTKKAILHKVIVCPSAPYLAYLKENLENAEIGAQDISKFKDGNFTGEVSAEQAKDFVKYAILGHHERREYFGESDREVKAKMHRCLENSVTPIVCIGNLKELGILNLNSKIIVAYEPVFAIGTGDTDTPKHISEITNEIKEKFHHIKVLYGGSVSEENIKSFSSIGLDGFLVGGESLDAKSFYNICAT